MIKDIILDKYKKIKYIYKNCKLKKIYEISDN